MITALLPEVQLGRANPQQAALPLHTQGVLRYVWHSAFGSMLIEVKEGVAYVNGERVRPFSGSGAGARRQGDARDGLAQSGLSV